MSPLYRRPCPRACTQAYGLTEQLLLEQIRRMLNPNDRASWIARHRGYRTGSPESARCQILTDLTGHMTICRQCHDEHKRLAMPKCLVGQLDFRSPALRINNSSAAERYALVPVHAATTRRLQQSSDTPGHNRARPLGVPVVDVPCLA